MNEQETATVAAPAAATNPGPIRAAHAAPAPTTNPAPATAEQEKLKAIRDILVGEQLDGLNRRFHTLEQNHQAQYAKIGNELMTKFEALQVLSKTQIGDLEKSVSETVSKLHEKDAGLTQEIQEGKKQIADLGKRIDDMQTSLAQQLRKMHEQVSGQMSEFSSAIKARQDEAVREAVSRKDFAKLLNGLAGNLAPEGAPPKNVDSRVEPHDEDEE